MMHRPMFIICNLIVLIRVVLVFITNNCWDKLIMCRRSHKSGSDIWAILGKEGDIGESFGLHGGSVFGSYLWSGVG